MNSETLPYIVIIICFIGGIYVSYLRGFIAGENSAREYMKYQDKMISDLMNEHLERSENK